MPVDPDCHEQGVVCHFYEAGGLLFCATLEHVGL